MYTQEQKNSFKGIGALVLTMFDQDLKLKTDEMQKNIRFMIDNGINSSNGFLVCNGSTGECYAMNLEERKQVVRATVEAANKEIPVVACCNDTNAFSVVELADHAKKAGADAALIIQSYYLPFNEEQIYNFFQFVNQRVDIPIMIYNNPSVCSGVEMSMDLLKRLAKLDKVFALKQTTNSSRHFIQSQTLASELLIFTGSSSTEPFGDMAGMHGFFSFLSCFYPQMQIELWEAIHAKDYIAAQKIHTKELLLYDWWWNGGLGQTFGQIVHAKKALELMGHYGGPSRPPLVPLKDAQTEKLKQIMHTWGLI
jgi:4-hydroxy-tetrahydrodipicolinate synthase